MAPITQFSQLDLSKSYTYADYLTWEFPEYVEMIGGRVLPYMPGRSSAHQQCLGNLMGAVHKELKRRPEKMVQIPFDVLPTYKNGQADNQLGTVVQPDLIVASDPAMIQERGCFGAPDWVVEILSPGFTDRDIRIKFRLYEESGVREYWLVYLGLNNVAVYLLENGRYQVSAEYARPSPIPVATLPGFAIKWTDIFADD
ncbi:MAG: Uma2 family endonuclease [Janthinobacterium lividum]